MSINLAQYRRLSKLYFDDPIGFIEDIICYEEKPDSEGVSKLLRIGQQQREVLKAVAKSGRDRKYVAVKSGHGTGKTCVASWIALWFVFTRHNSRAGILAPTERQAKSLWGEMKFWINQSPLLPDFFDYGAEIIGVKNFDGSKDTQGNWQMELRTASCAENVAGLHGKGGTLIIVDEASGITDKDIITTLEGAVSDKNSIFLMIGNPTQLFGEFYDAFHKSKKRYRTLTLSCEHKDYRGDKQYVRNMLEKFGRHSNEYKIRVLGEFPSSESDSYISLQELTSTYNQETKRLMIPIISVDPADFGADNTEICAGVGNHVYYWRSIKGRKDGHDNVRAILDCVRHLRENSEEYGFPRGMAIEVIIDVNGVGASTRDVLKQYARRENLKIVENKAQWAGDATAEKMADLLWVKMSEQLTELCIPFNKFVAGSKNELSNKDFFDGADGLERSICSRKYSIPNGKIVLESKDKMRSNGMRSPDKGDCLALYCFLLSKHKKAKQGIFGMKTTAFKINPEGGLI